MEYCRLSAQSQHQFSNEFLSQLRLIMRFEKEEGQSPFHRASIVEKDVSEDHELELLNDLPDIKKLVGALTVFRANLMKEDLTGKAIESKLPSFTPPPSIL